jgi:hypothetical protein
MVFRFLQSIFTASSGPSGKYGDATIQAAIERVVDGTDPRLRAVRHYRRKLWDAVERSVEYVVTLVDALPPAIDASRRAFTATPQLRATFVSLDHLRDVLTFSKHMRNYLRDNPGPLPAELYAVLGMERGERTVLGIEMHGDLIRRDVPQTTVNFSNQRLAFPTASEQETRQELMKRAFDTLIELALANLVAIRARRRHLEQLHGRLLEKKARVMASAQIGLESLLEPTTPTLADCAAIQRQLWDLEAELVQVRADTATIEQLLARVAATLGEPEKYLRMERVSLTLDHMNVKAPPDSPRITSTLTFDEALLGNDRRLTVLLVRFPSDELLPQPDFFQEANRLLYLGGQPRLTTI